MWLSEGSMSQSEREAIGVKLYKELAQDMFRGHQEEGGCVYGVELDLRQWTRQWVFFFCLATSAVADFLLTYALLCLL